MKLIFLGPPGAGKGTLAERARKILEVPQISTGAIFRAAIAAKTELGLKVKAVIDAGKLVDDELTVALVKDRLSQADAHNGYILDGFPRTIAQADALAQFSAVDKVVNFTISDEAVVKRLSGRRVCPQCGTNFHAETLKPQKEGVCDKCGAGLIIRDDDQAETIARRLDVYRAETLPLIDYYKRKGILVDVEAADGIDRVVENFKAAIHG
ncbi:MAG: adenylate kinase [Spirochaetaceae bacterium]|jgi:adenylate kinase|nr:adenylate kinase [Spirochaetaceae bacterium]